MISDHRQQIKLLSLNNVKKKSFQPSCNQLYSLQCHPYRIALKYISLQPLLYKTCIWRIKWKLKLHQGSNTTMITNLVNQETITKWRNDLVRFDWKQTKNMKFVSYQSKYKSRSVKEVTSTGEKKQYKGDHTKDIHREKWC